MTQRRRLTNLELLFSRWQLGIILLGGILTVLGDAGTIRATAGKGIQERTLSNGLKIVLGEDHWHPLAALAVCYRAGSRNDPAGKQGLAHLLEHLTFRSLGLPHAEEATPTAGPGRAGATTIHDTTCYSSRLLRTELEQALVVEAARMATLQISADDLEHEKAIVINERRQLVEGDTWRNFLEEIDSIAFRLHPYRFPTSGWPETLAQISLDDVQQHFATYYAPGNAILVVVGDFDTQNLFVRIESTFGQISARALPAPSVYVEPASGGERRILVAPLGAPRIAYAYHVPAFGSLENSTLEVLSTLLTDGDQARLSALLYGQHLATAVGIEYSPLNRDPGLFYIKVALGSPANYRLTGQAVDEVLWHLRKDGLRPGELERAKKRLLLDFYLNQSLETQADRLGQYGALAALPRAEHYPDELRAVTAADVQHTVRAYFLPKDRVVGLTGVARQEEERLHKEEKAR